MFVVDIKQAIKQAFKGNENQIHFPALPFDNLVKTIKKRTTKVVLFIKQVL